MVPASTVPSLAADLRKGEYPDGAGAAPLYQIHRFDGAGSFVTELRVVPVP